MKTLCIQPPTRRIVQIGFYDENDVFQTNKHFLSFPFVVFCISYQEYEGKFYFDGLALAFAAQSDAIDLYFPSLYNVFLDNELMVCMPKLMKIYNNRKSLFQDVSHQFWVSSFTDNWDRFVGIYQSARLLLGSYNEWQKQTKEYPLWIPGKKDMIKIPVDLANHVFGNRDNPNDIIKL